MIKLKILKKWQRDFFNRENFTGMKLADQILKIAEIIIDKLIWQQLDIDEMQFIFKSVCGTTNAILILAQRQEKYLAKTEEFVLCICVLHAGPKACVLPPSVGEK